MLIDLILFNTLGRKKETFKPLQNNEVRLYTCGPTVYNYAHIGNLRAYIFADTLKRTLLYNNYKVKHIMNITDVGHLVSDADDGEDKIEREARREKKSVWDIAQFYTNAFKNDLLDLNIINPDKFVKATDTITEQITLIQKLENKGFTYKTSDGIYFDTARLPNYGKLANLQSQKLKAGARVAENKEKRNATDFALWKFSLPSEQRQMEWKSPWGIGFPGWHIECSAIATKHLGQPFDIHTGGIDHIGTHHTNEIAQSEGAYNKPLANFWMHTEFVTIKGGKMAKSENNFITLTTLKEKEIEPQAFRLLILQAHYKSKLDFSWESIQAAQNSWINIKKDFYFDDFNEIDPKQSKLYLKTFKKLINDDLNTPQALALFFDVLQEKDKKTLLEMDKVLGLGLDKLKHKKIIIPQEIQKLANKRKLLRQEKKWQEADKIRKEIEKQGYEIKDMENEYKIVTTAKL